MRLLDHIAQCSAPFIVGDDAGQVWRLPGASDFALPLQRCPLRYVLSDDLVRTCTALAYSEGDELCGCLDLLHLPAEELWIEWNDVVRRAEVARNVPECPPSDDPEIVRAGALIRADARGRSATVRTFWMTRRAPEEPVLAPVETLLDLDRPAAAAAPERLLEGCAVSVRDWRNAQVDELLQNVTFRLDPLWQRYYQQVAHGALARAEVIGGSLGAVAFDVPVLLALFLLMGLRAHLVQQPVNPASLNAKRLRLGRRPLLAHIEISAPVFAPPLAPHAESAYSARRGPRFHHVRGHIVRRHDTVYWRAPHWRGHVRLGHVRSRTVELRPPLLGATREGTASGARGSAG